MKRILVLAALVALGASACMKSYSGMAVLDKRVDASHPAGYLGLPLRTGQFVLSESPDATSFLFPLIPQKFYPFTHVAIVSIEEGEPYVYDVSGEVKTFPLSKRVLDNVTGKMYRRKLYDYVSPNIYVEIYDPPPGPNGEWLGDKIAAFVQAKYKEGVEFDAYFDFHDHSKLFCTELVELSIRAAGGKATELQPSNPNPSIVDGMKWLGVPAGEALPAGIYADPKRYYGALGQFPTRTSAWLYFEAKREIHRRFTMDQRLGFILTIDNNGRVDVRPEISAFAIAASHLFDAEEKPPEPGDPRLQEAVRKLADTTFGPFPDSR